MRNPYHRSRRDVQPTGQPGVLRLNLRSTSNKPIPGYLRLHKSLSCSLSYTVLAFVFTSPSQLWSSLRLRRRYRRHCHIVAIVVIIIVSLWSLWSLWSSWSSWSSQWSSSTLMSLCFIVVVVVVASFESRRRRVVVVRCRCVVLAKRDGWRLLRAEALPHSLTA